MQKFDRENYAQINLRYSININYAYNLALYYPRLKKSHTDLVGLVFCVAPLKFSHTYFLFKLQGNFTPEFFTTNNGFFSFAL